MKGYYPEGKRLVNSRHLLSPCGQSRKVRAEGRLHTQLGRLHRLHRRLATAMSVIICLDPESASQPLSTQLLQTPVAFWNGTQLCGECQRQLYKSYSAAAELLLPKRDAVPQMTTISTKQYSKFMDLNSTTDGPIRMIWLGPCTAVIQPRTAPPAPCNVHRKCNHQEGCLDRDHGIFRRNFRGIVIPLEAEPHILTFIFGNSLTP